MSQRVTKPPFDDGFASLPLGITPDPFDFKPPADGLAIEGVEVDPAETDANGIFFPCGLPEKDDAPIDFDTAS